MNALDVCILALVALLALLGYAQGFIIGFASLFGVALGGVVGTRMSQAILERAATDAQASAWAPVLGLLVGLLVTIIGALAMQDLGTSLRYRLATGEHLALDRALGSLLLAAVGLVLVWFAAASAIGVPALRDQRDELLGSRVLANLNRVLPPAGPILGAISSYDPFPTFDGGVITTGPPDETLLKDAQMNAATRSVLRVIGTACNYTVTGSSWVVADGYVVTNAHVVAGESDTEVQPPGGGRSRHADVVHFDPVNDIAILRVKGLGLRVLRPVSKPAKGTAGVIVGYPENHGLSTNAARYSDERTVRAAGIRGTGKFSRDVTSFRGIVRHGNSGGPVIDGNGNVLTTVFAATVGARVRGGYGVPNQRVLAALAAARQVRQGFGVSTGSCID